MFKSSFVVVEDCLSREFSLGTSFFRHYAVLVELKYRKIITRNLQQPPSKRIVHEQQFILSHSWNIKICSMGAQIYENACQNAS